MTSIAVQRNVRQTEEVSAQLETEEHHKSRFFDNFSEKFFAQYDYLLCCIPEMSMNMAIILCGCNIIVPGLGTCLLSAMERFKSTPNDAVQNRNDNNLWMNAGVGGLQFATIFLFFFGWIWSIMWGLEFLIKGKQHNLLRRNASNHRRSQPGGNHPVVPQPIYTISEECQSQAQVHESLRQTS